jgi:hypothetical protein
MMPMLPDVVAAGTRGARPHRAMGAMVAEDNDKEHALFCASTGFRRVKLRQAEDDETISCHVPCPRSMIAD